MPLTIQHCMYSFNQCAVPKVIHIWYLRGLQQGNLASMVLAFLKFPSNFSLIIYAYKLVTILLLECYHNLQHSQKTEVWNPA